MGSIARLSVAVSPSYALGFHWQFGGAGIPGDSGLSTLVLSNVQRFQDGVYTVRVTNWNKQVVEASTLLTVILPPELTKVPLPR